ncbi:MAG: phage tail tube protein [Pyrinomonadaceae bacterium]
MSTTFKQKNVVAACSPLFVAQTDIDTPLDSALLTAVLPLPRDARPLPSRRVTREETRECRGRYLVGRRITSRLALWSLRMDATAQLVAGFAALAMGAAATPTGAGPRIHEITHGESDDVSKTSFIVGTEGDDDEPSELYKALAVNRMRVAGEVRGKVSLEVDFIGSADVTEVEDFEFPACGTVLPVYTNDCELLINAVNRTSDLRSFAYEFNNNLLSNDDPFPFDSVDIARLERDVESSQFTFAIYGTKAHPVYVDALAELTRAVSLRIGSATEYAKIIAAGAQLALQDTDLGYAGEASRSVINVDCLPLSLDGNAPDRVSASLSQADRFLVAPA